MAADVQLPPSRPRPASHVDVYLQVLNALILRDMRSRFGGNYWGYLVQVLWPSRAPWYPRRGYAVPRCKVAHGR